MPIENKGIPNEEIENTNDTMSENEELQKIKEVLEKRETIEGHEKLEAYLNYLVNWKNEIIRKQDETKRKVEDVLITGNIGGFFNPTPEKKRETSFRGSDTLFSDLAEKFNEIQYERNLWANEVSSTIYGTPYNSGDLEYPHDNPKVIDQYFFITTKDNEHVVESIESLGLNKFEYPTVAISKKVLEGDLPLYEVDEDEHSTIEKWLHVKDGKFVVESRHSENDENGNNYHNKKEYDTYEEALKSFVTNEFLKKD